MTDTRLLITAVVVEKRSVPEVAAQYGVSRSWLYELLARYRTEGEAVFEPRSKRPRSNPNATPAEVVDLIVELREKLTATGLDAGPDTIVWHLAQHHDITVSRATVARHLAKRGLVTAGRLHSLPAHPSRRPSRPRHRDLDLAGRLFPLRPAGDSTRTGHRPDRGRRVR